MQASLPLATGLFGIAIGWFLHPPPGNAAGSPVAANGRFISQPPETLRDDARSTARPTGGESSAALPSDREEGDITRLTDGTGENVRQMVGSIFDARLKILVTRLGLSPAQVEAIQTERQKYIESLGSFFDSDGSYLRSKADGLAKWLEQSLPGTGILTSAQADQYQTILTAERKTRLDATALKDLGTVSTLLDLSAGQRQGIHEALVQRAILLDEQKNPIPWHAFGGEPLEWSDEVGGREVVQTLTEFNSTQNGSSKSRVEELQAQLRETVKRRTAEQLETLRPYLTEDQLAEYRLSLEVKASGIVNLIDSL